MKGVLDVYLGRKLAGRLTQDEHGLTTFGYDTGWLAAPDAVPLSHSMLLRSGVFGRNECGAFFAGVLPESGKRNLVARNLVRIFSPGVLRIFAKCGNLSILLMDLVKQ